MSESIIEGSLTLLAVLALAIYVLFLVRRGSLARPSGPLEVLARLPLESRRSVYVVRIANQLLIVGSSETGLTSLGELPPETLAQFSEQTAPPRLIDAVKAAMGRAGDGK